MIRVHLYTDEEWLEASAMNKKHEFPVRNAYDHLELNMLNTAIKDKTPKPPFRDEASRQFLKETYNITFASDEDWYSVLVETNRVNIICLNRGVLMGLAAIDLSKHGIYTQFKRSEKRIWRALDNLNMDILIRMQRSQMGVYRENIKGVDFVIEDYPYRNETVEVTVKDEFILDKEFYDPVSEYRENNTSYDLQKGR